MYIAEAIPDLVRTLDAICSPSGQVLIAHGRNRGGESTLMSQVGVRNAMHALNLSGRDGHEMGMGFNKMWD